MNIYLDKETKRHAEYVLATRHNIVKWYYFDPTKKLNPDSFTLDDTLDLNRIPVAGSKDTAKRWAKELELKTWRYVKIK